MSEASKDYRLGSYLWVLRAVHEIMKWHHDNQELCNDLIGALMSVTEDTINEASPDAALVLDTQTITVSEGVTSN